MKKIAAKFSLTIGIITLLLTAFLLYQAYLLAGRRVREVVEEQASMALRFNLAIRSYVEQKIRPVMYELLGEEEFIPETMSTSFIARSIFEDVRSEFPEYVLKFSSQNPRNPANQASPEEIKVLEYLNKHPALQKWEGEIKIDGKPYLAKFNVRHMRESCLRCHGDPMNAPLSLLKRYGAIAGFHQPVDEIMASDTVAIPMKKIEEKLWSEFMPVFLSGCIVLLLLFLTVLFSVRFTITKRLGQISSHFAEAASQKDYSKIEPIQMKGKDEISVLAQSFNTLSLKLKRIYTSLDSQVGERTRELEEKNRLLQNEINERTRVEEALRESETLYRRLVEQSHQGLVIAQDNPLRLRFVSRPIEEITGYTLAEFQNFGAKQLLELIHLDDRERFFQNFRNRISGKSAPVSAEYRLIHKTKGPRWVEICASMIDYQGKPASYALFSDITERKIAEQTLRESELKLARSSKMESLGLLAGGVAHDLNNVLSGIVSYPELILMDLPKDSKLRKPVETIMASGNRAAAIVQDLLTLARGVATAKEPLNLNDFIHGYLDSPEFAHLMADHAGVKIQKDLGDDLLHVNGSPVHIQKSIMNLVSNGAEAITGSGIVTIRTANCYVDRPMGGYETVKTGEYVLLEVSDNGTGISSVDLDRIFEPFYTRKHMGKSGTGLGLAVVWNVVQDHGGYIDVESNRQGTTFKMYFPITRESLPNKVLSASKEEIKGQGELILVVDDVESQREISSRMLEILGYQTEAVSSGEEAVSYLTENSVDLVLLDMIMDPGIDGLETYRRIIKIHPVQKAIIVSGFANNQKVKAAQEIGAGPYLKKPLTLEILGAAVKKTLFEGHSA